MQQSFEQLLSRFCAPTLAGIKPASLFACSKQTYPHLRSLLCEYNRQLNGAGLFFRIMQEQQRALLLFVYCEPVLRQALAEPARRDMLLGYGYAEPNDIEQSLRHLQQRFAKKSSFPHEIGLFLGYPPADCAGFCQKALLDQQHGGR